MRITYSILILTIFVIILTYTIGCFYAYFYPMTYADTIMEYASSYDIDSALVASVVNSESGFKDDAKSQKGAIGLMQLMPSTAEWVAMKLNEEYREECLYEAEYNIKLGTYYLSYLIKYFNDTELGLCAYNAGQGNVISWLSNKEYSSDGKTLNKIPYKETKDYLNRVYKNYHYYKNKYK